MTKIKTYNNIVEKMNELEELLSLAKEELSVEADKKSLDSQIFTFSSFLFQIKLPLAISALKLFEKTLPEKMQLLEDLFDEGYDLGISDYGYWTWNVYAEELEAAHYRFIAYRRDYSANIMNETAFNEFYTKVITLRLLHKF